MKIIVIEPTRLPEVREIEGTLEEIRAILGGYLERLRLTEDADAYVDEDAKCKANVPPVNGFATHLFQTFLIPQGQTMIPGDAINGSMVIIGNRDEKGQHDCEWHDVPKHVIVKVMKMVKAYKIGTGGD